MIKKFSIFFPVSNSENTAEQEQEMIQTNKDTSEIEEIEVSSFRPNQYIKLKEEPIDEDDTDSNLNPVVAEEEEEEFPWNIVIVGSFANATESFTSNIMYPFVEDYCSEWLNIPNGESSIWSGLLIGIFNIGLAISNPWLGALSDIYGRKSILLIGMFISALCTFLLAFVRSISWAIVLRFFAGFANANLSVSKALVSDVTKKQHNRSLAFVYFAGSFAFFRCVATFVSGITVHQTFGLFDSYPYLLPFLLTLILNLGCCLSVFLLVPNYQKKKERTEPLYVEIPSKIVSGMKELVSTRLMIKMTSAMTLNHFCSGYVLLIIAMYAQLERIHHGYGMSIAESSYLIAIFGLAGFLFQILFSRRLTSLMRARIRYILFNSILCFSLLCFPMVSFIYWNDSPPSSDDSVPPPPSNDSVFYSSSYESSSYESSSSTYENYNDFSSPLSVIEFIFDLSSSRTYSTPTISSSSNLFDLLSNSTTTTTTTSTTTTGSSSTPDIDLSYNQTVTMWVLICICCIIGGAAYIYVMPTLSAIQSLVISPSNFGNSMGTMTGIGQISRGCGPFVAGMMISLGKSSDFPFACWILPIFMYVSCSVLLVIMSPEELALLDRETQTKVVKPINVDDEEDNDEEKEIEREEEGVYRDSAKIPLNK